MKILRVRPLPARPIPLFATLTLLLAAAPAALAQTSSKPKKKAAKPADTTEAAPDSSSSSSSSSSEEEPKRPDKAATSAASESTSAEVPATATAELPGKRYYFVGARYRLTVIPQFIINLFVNEGATFVEHTVGAELDMRKDGQSTIPWIAYQSFSTPDTLFQQKNGDPNAPFAANWSVVNSSLSALFLGLDELWSAPLDESHHWDFEYGFGVGIGIVFGSLSNNWVYQNANGPLHSANNGNFSECQAVPMGTTGPAGCNLGDHKNATIPKVVTNGVPYTEPNWFNGGSVPVLFPHIAIPQLGIRWKPVKQFESRLTVGFSLTGFFFGISGNYGLEKPSEKQGPGGGLASNPFGPSLR
jgi:hypothetical protein